MPPQDLRRLQRLDVPEDGPDRVPHPELQPPVEPLLGLRRPEERVADDRVAADDDAPAEEPEPPPEVDVLVVHEERPGRTPRRRRTRFGASPSPRPSGRGRRASAARRSRGVHSSYGKRKRVVEGVGEAASSRPRARSGARESRGAGGSSRSRRRPASSRRGREERPSQPASTTVSELRRTRRSPRASRAPRRFASPKPRFAPIGEDPHRRVVRADPREAVVGRPVVDEDHLAGPRDGPLERREALLEVVPAVVVDDDDRGPLPQRRADAPPRSARAARRPRQGVPPAAAARLGRPRRSPSSAAASRRTSRGR